MDSTTAIEPANRGFSDLPGLSGSQWRFVACMVSACVVCLSAWNVAAQDAQQTNQPPNPSPHTAVHGLVRNGASGEPLPHALVRINGDASTGVLTDGDGRFEIADVPEGPQEFTVVKPGFVDQDGADTFAWSPAGYGHNVIIAAPMGDVVFTMAPLNSIQGQVQLSTGDVAERVSVTLLKRIVQDGRAVWQNSATTKTNSEGRFRFGGLLDGIYAFYTEPAMESDAATNLVESGSSVAREGYASVFYPEARDLAGAAKIRLAGGEQAQANIALTLEPFRSVTATVTMPKVSSGAGENIAIQVTDAQSHPLPYTAQYDSATHTAQAALPDGAYGFRALLSTESYRVSSENGDAVTMNLSRSRPMIGETSFAVAGRAVSHLRIPVSRAGSNAVQITVARGPGGNAQGGTPKVYITLSQTGSWMSEGMVSSYAEGVASNTLETTPEPSGSYWVHTSIAPKVFCETSFTAGGASLAREPLVLASNGETAPLVLALRDDCARLNLSLPGSVGLSAGIEPYYTVYAVPDFDSTEDVIPQTLRPSSGGRITLTGLTPGNYHVYTFDKPVALEYRNPAVLAALPGQAVTLTPGAEAELTVEVPQR